MDPEVLKVANALEVAASEVASIAASYRLAGLAGASPKDAARLANAAALTIGKISERVGRCLWPASGVRVVNPMEA